MVVATDTKINPDVCVKAGALKAISLDVETPEKRSYRNVARSQCEAKARVFSQSQQQPIVVIRRDRVHVDRGPAFNA